MRHHEIDQYAKQSPLSRFDPRVKIVSTIVLVVSMAFLTGLYPLLICLGFLFALVAISNVPWKHLGKSYLMAFPFVLFASITVLLTSGPEHGMSMFLRVTNSLLALILLVSTTPFFDVLKSLRWFRVPTIISSLLLFTYRFIFVLLDELERMKIARKARGFEGGRNILQKDALRIIAYTAGMVFVRSNTRAGNIYDALRSRGYDGEIKTLNKLHASPKDAGYACAFFGVSLLSLFAQVGVIAWPL
ncbi:MAG: cobalt ECF transporter T component CbiQ [Methanomassiliicoccales archaeon]|nr:cobalt ECF transporter T component CbiQ [Methanomassiliicoccales archaeon]